MAVALKLSNELIEAAKPHAAAEHRSMPKQIEYWARIGNSGLQVQNEQPRYAAGMQPQT